MKTSNWKMILATMVIAGSAASSAIVMAQTSAETNPVAVSTPATPPQLAYGVPQIVQLTQAKISDDTITAYIKNSGTSYNLDANQIIYLRQQGVSDAVITMMLNQPKAGSGAPANSTYAPSQSAYSPPPTMYSPPAETASSAPAPITTTAPAPAVSYVQTVPATTYYYSSPYYYPAYGYYGYPYGYGYYPPVSLSFGWGWGGGWRGGWGGGWHGGGGFHGGRR